MGIVPSSEKALDKWVTTRPKAVVLTFLSLLWILLSIGAAAFDLSPLVAQWPLIRSLVWVIHGVLLVCAILLWRFERPRRVRLKGGLLEPPVIHLS